MEEYCFGTGGLVRAYSEATEKLLSEENIVKKDLGMEVKFKVSYSDLQKLQYYLEKNNLKILNSNFGENVEVIFETTKSNLEKIINNHNLNFKILDYKIIKNKYIGISHIA